MYCLNMLEIALKMAKVDSTYEDIDSKLFEHFLYTLAPLMELAKLSCHYATRLMGWLTDKTKKLENI